MSLKLKLLYGLYPLSLKRHVEIIRLIIGIVKPFCFARIISYGQALLPLEYITHIDKSAHGNQHSDLESVAALIFAHIKLVPLGHCIAVEHHLPESRQLIQHEIVVNVV